MPGLDDFEWQLERNLQRCFGSQEKFGHWLSQLDLVGFAPINEESMGREVMSSIGGAAPAHGARMPSSDEVMAGLRQQGVGWSEAIRRNLERAESEWPSVADSHSAVLDRIRKAWKYRGRNG